MSGLYALLFPLLAAPAVQSPASVQATNQAFSEAVRCTTRTTAQPFPGCAPLEQAGAERVRFPEFGDASRPESWTQALEVRLNDGSWKHFEEMHRSFHGMVWVAEIGLYVGYAAWYGEEGGTVLIHPETGALVVAKGVPQLTPDRALMLAVEVDVYSDGELRVQAFSVEGVPRKLYEQRVSAQANALEQVVFVPERSTAVLYFQDMEGRIQGVSVDLSAHWPARPANLLSVEACEQSKTARYVIGDQVYLRAGPARDAEILAALPWGSCVQLEETPGDWELVRMAEHRGFLAGKLLTETPPERRSRESWEGYPDTYCTGVDVAVGTGEMPVRAALAANRRAGLEGYYIRPQYDDHCIALRPAEWPLQSKPLGDFERVADPDLNSRFALWTLALAPENAYRKHSSAAVLNASPLARPHPEAHSSNTNTKLPGMAWGELAQVFGSVELRKTPPPSVGVHLLQIVPEDDGVLLSGFRLWEDLGLSQGGFPAGRFQVSEDLTRVAFERSLPAAALDPCTGELLPTQLSEVAYDPSSGTVRGRLDDRTQERLKACMASIPEADFPQLQFVVLVDESDGHQALAAAAGEGERRVVPQPLAHGTYAVELRWSADQVEQAFLRSVVYGDCGMYSVHVFQFYDGKAWQRVQVQATDWSDCGL